MQKSMNKNSAHKILLSIIGLFIYGLSTLFAQYCPSDVVTESSTWWWLIDGNFITWAYVDGDEFNDDELDRMKWHTAYPWGRNYNPTQYMEYMTDGANMEFTGSHLKLTARDEPIYARGIPYEADNYVMEDGGPNLRWWNYTSGMIASRAKHKRGLYEIKAKIPSGVGLWPGFWLYAGEPNEELDVVEWKGERTNEFHIDIHCPNGCDNYGNLFGTASWSPNVTGGFGGWLQVSGSLAAADQCYWAEWYDDAVLWYMNGFFAGGWLGTLNYQGHLIANLGLGTGQVFGPGVDASTPFPAALEIDYIRVWERIDCNQSVSICNRTQNNSLATTITGSTITLGSGVNCDFQVPSGNSLKVIASEAVVLGNGFSSSLSAYIDAKIVDCTNTFYRSSHVDDDAGINIYTRDSISTAEKIVALGIVSEAQARSDIMHIRSTPNPTAGNVNIEVFGKIKPNVKLVLLNRSGAILKEMIINEAGVHQIDMDAYSPGVYILEVINGDAKATQRIVLQ